MDLKIAGRFEIFFRDEYSYIKSPRVFGKSIAYAWVIVIEYEYKVKQKLFIKGYEMILAVDVFYIDDRAKSVGVLFNAWQDACASDVVTDYRDDVAAYQSGAFYLRELPCILSLLEKVDLSKIDAIVVDGYVYLNDGKIGLGGHLYQALKQAVPIIGVAKKPFFANADDVQEVFRGKSKNPLYITSVGIDVELAASYIQTMDGKYRMPTLLSYLDQKTKVFKDEVSLSS